MTTRLGAEPTKAEVDALLADLANHGGPEGIALDERGAAHLADEDGRGFTLVFRQELAGLVLTAPLLAPGEAPRELLVRLLMANGDTSLTGGGSFAMDGTDDQLVFCQRLPLAGLDAAACSNALTSFHTYVVRLTNSLQSMLKRTSNEPQPDLMGYAIRV